MFDIEIHAKRKKLPLNGKWPRTQLKVAVPPSLSVFARDEQSYNMLTKDSCATCDIRLQDAAVSINQNTTQLTSINVKYKSA